MKLTAHVRTMQDLLPGVGISAIVAMSATFLSEHHGGPTLLYALLIGMTLYFLSKGTVAAPGIQFASRFVLRLGVAMLGVRISAGKIAELGVLPIAIVVCGVISTILLGRFIAQRFELTPVQGVLTGGAVAICGASAALAISAVLPRSKDSESNTLFTVIAVTLLSTIAMVIYPVIIHAVGFSHHKAGILLGGTIHDVAQVVGAGYLISDETGIVATYVKLLRVAMLVPVVATLAWIYADASSASGKPTRPVLPAFLISFVVLAILNSFHLVPKLAQDVMAEASRWCLVMAIAALGMKTSLQELAKIGWRPLALVVMETVWLLVLVFIVLRVSGTA